MECPVKKMRSLSMAWFSRMSLNTLIASIWGMNTRVPGDGSHAGFFAVVGVMAIVLIATIVLFRRRGWL